jgi:hypothetical protein
MRIEIARADVDLGAGPALHWFYKKPKGYR